MRWTTIGLSAGTQLRAANNDSPAEPAPKPLDWKRRIASVWIPAILGLGLLMAFAYVGVRIVAGKSQAVAPAVVAQAPVIAPSAPPPQPSPPSKTVPSPAAVPTPPANFTLITPQPGERYLQVAAVSPHMVLIYVDTLRTTNLNAVVAPGPAPDLLRILVGPFSDPDAMEKVRAQLVATGRSPIVRSY